MQLCGNRLKVSAYATRQRIKRAKLLDDEEVTDGEGIDACAIETADGFARIGHERFAKKIEGCVEEHRRWSALTKFVEQAPEARVGFALDGVNADLTVFKGKTLQFWRGVLPELAERGHEAAVR